MVPDFLSIVNNTLFIYVYVSSRFSVNSPNKNLIVLLFLLFVQYINILLGLILSNSGISDIFIIIDFV